MCWRRKRPKADVGKGHGSYAVFFIEAEVSQDVIGGCGIKSDIGMKIGAIALDMDLVTSQDAVAMLRGRWGPTQNGGRFVDLQMKFA